MGDQAPAPENVVLRFTNAPDQPNSCSASYHTYDSFDPDWAAIAVTDMYAWYLSERDFKSLLESVNEVLATHRRWQKTSSIGAAFATLVAIIIAVFVVYAGVAFQIVALVIHLIVTQRLLTICLAEVNDMLDADVNPAIDARGVQLVLSSARDGCAATPCLHLEFVKLANFEQVSRPPRYSALTSPGSVSRVLVDEDLAFSNLVVGSPTGSPRRGREPSRSPSDLSGADPHWQFVGAHSAEVVIGVPDGHVSLHSPR